MGALKFGMQDQRVLELKKKLKTLGAASIDETNVFDIATYVAVKAFQRAEGLYEDGIVGPLTDAELATAKGNVAAPRTDNVIPIKPVPPEFSDDIKWFGAPWVAFLAERIGWTEFTHDKQLSQYWPLVHLSTYKTVIGSDFAWCALIIEPMLRSAGFTGTRNAAAVSYEDYGDRAEDYWFGSIIHLKHYKKGNHVTVFLYWVDKKKRLAACLGGNQNNGIRITIYDLSGPGEGKETNPGGPRWPKGAKPGRVVTEAEAKVLFKQAGYDIGGSTR